MSEFPRRPDEGEHQPEQEHAPTPISALEAATMLAKLFSPEDAAGRLGAYLGELSPEDRAKALESIVSTALHLTTRAETAERERAQERRSALTHPLANLGTKQSLYEVLRREGDTNPDKNPRYTAIGFDAKDLKAGNDRVGEAFGDAMIAAMGAAVRASLSELSEISMENSGQAVDLTDRYSFYIDDEDIGKIVAPGEEITDEDRLLHQAFAYGGDEALVYLPNDIPGIKNSAEIFISLVGKHYDRGLRIVIGSAEHMQYPNIVVDESGVYVTGTDNNLYPLTLRSAYGANMAEMQNNMHDVKMGEDPTGKYRSS